MVMVQIGRKLPLIGSSALNFVLAVVVAVLLQVFGTDKDLVNYTVVVLLCIFGFSLTLSWS